MATREWNGETLRMRAELAELFDRGLNLFKAEAGLDEIMNLLLAKDSPIWRDGQRRRLRGRDVIKLPVYKAIKNMARQRGVAMGLLSEDRPGTQPKLEDFSHDA
jgi:hypothetical protein